MGTSTRRAMLRAAGIAALPFGLVGPQGLATSRLAASFDPISHLYLPKPATDRRPARPKAR
jgi:hypothetical protein